jgi:hypothetical protein
MDQALRIPGLCCHLLASAGPRLGPLPLFKGTVPILGQGLPSAATDLSTSFPVF